MAVGIFLTLELSRFSGWLHKVKNEMVACSGHARGVDSRGLLILTSLIDFSQNEKHREISIGWIWVRSPSMLGLRTRSRREALGNKVVKRSLRSDLFLMNVLGAD